MILMKLVRSYNSNNSIFLYIKQLEFQRNKFHYKRIANAFNQTIDKYK